MKKDGNRISLTIKEADETREYLETLYAMEGTLDEEDFNSECHRAGFYARNMCKLIHGHSHPTWDAAGPVEPKYNPLI